MENYKGSVELMAGLKQKNDGNFPLLNTEQIQAKPDGTRLNTLLDNLNTSLPSILVEQDDNYNVTISANSGGTTSEVVINLGDALDAKAQEVINTIGERLDYVINEYVPEGGGSNLI